jgi:tRNA A-37 threonylcarbamoyl transferase component Bud32
MELVSVPLGQENGLMELEIDPALAARGYATFQSLFTHPGAEVIGGHRSRQVARFELGPCRGFLKRQHWIPWKDYFASWWAGFGFVDRSRREWNTLVALRQQSIPCPEPLAVGRRNGQSFLLVRELAGSVDLQTYLANPAVTKTDRRALARRLGQTLARLHMAGFTHPDLYAKHVFIGLADQAIALIDFQRTTFRRWVGWRQRWRDLAALDASLGEHVISEAERLHLLAAYLRETGAVPLLKKAVAAIRRRTRHLLKRRKIQAMRHPWQLVPGARQIEHLRVTYEPRFETEP